MITHPGTFFQKAKAGERLKVAYLGGSITFGATSSDPLKTSWRAKTAAWLQETYPEARITPIDAAIGGKPSQLGVFRMERDVLPCNPDLTFVEFSVNDGNKEWAGETMEGIVRKLHAKNQDMTIVVVLIGAGWTYKPSGAAALHEEIAAHYGLPSIRLWEGVQQGIAKGDYTTKDILTDGTHPSDKGYDVYTHIVEDALSRFAKLAPNASAPWPAPKTANRYESAKMIELSKTKLPDSWKAATPSTVGEWFDHQPSRWQDSCVIPTAEGAALALDLPSTTGIGLYYEQSGKGGIIDIAADGTKHMTVDVKSSFHYATVGYGFEFCKEPVSKITLTAAQAEQPKAAYLLVTSQNGAK